MQRVLYIMRGLPGSGKSTLARKLTECVCSADAYFTDPYGEYHFNPDWLTEAHDQCKALVEEHMQDGKRSIVVDNTNILFEHMAPYFELARKYAYSVAVVIPANPWSNDPEECFENCTHGVPLDKIKQMKNDFEW